MCVLAHVVNDAEEMYMIRILYWYFIFIVNIYMINDY